MTRIWDVDREWQWKRRLELSRLSSFVSNIHIYSASELLLLLKDAKEVLLYSTIELCAWFLYHTFGVCAELFTKG